MKYKQPRPGFEFKSPMAWGICGSIPDRVIHNIELAARGIHLHVNSDKTEFMCIKQDGAISTLNSKALKWALFPCLGSNILSYESDA